MSRFFPILAGLVLLFFAGSLGWWQADVKNIVINSNQGKWHAPQRMSSNADSLNALQQRIFDAGYLTGKQHSGSQQELKPEQEDSAMSAAEKQYGRFPHIISIAQIDGRYTAQLRQDDNTILTVHAGDTLPSGWVITTIVQNYLEADAGAERFSFAVFEHKDSQDQVETNE
jgi:hypothetical protein